jgi:S-formylglutathione hydrolase
MPGNWTRLTIGGKPAVVFDPPGRPRFAVLYLHAYGQESPADSPAYAAAFAASGVACVAPWGGRSWWADRVCPEFDPQITPERHILDAVLPWARNRWQLADRPVGACGISMGGQGAVRLGFKHPDRFPVVASVAGAFDYQRRYGRGEPLDEMYDSPERCRQDTAILHVDPAHTPELWFACDPDDDEWIDGNERLHSKLTAVGVPHAADLTTRAGGHSWAYFDAMAEPMVGFVADALDRLGRRLL